VHSPDGFLWMIPHASGLTVQPPHVPGEPLPPHATYVPGARMSSRYWFSGFSLQSVPTSPQGTSVPFCSTSWNQFGPGSPVSEIPER